MRKVIGYYYNIEAIIKPGKIEPDELIGSTVQLCFGNVLSDSNIKEEISQDIIEEMLNKNIARIISIDNSMAKVILEHPVPENIFKEYYTEETPIYE